MPNFLIAGMGGFIGSALRYLLSGWVQRFCGEPWFPYGTLSVNMIGCLLIGLLGGLADNRGVFSHEVRLFIILGMLGGFTTFSTFGYETLALFRDQQIFLALVNVSVHVVLGVFAAWLGYTISNWA